MWGYVVADSSIGVLIADIFAFVLVWWHKLLSHTSKRDK